MKHIRQFCATIVLVLVLTGAASADGIIHTGSPAPVAPPSSKIGIIHTGVAAPGEELKGEKTTVDLATEIALSLVQSILALF